MKHVDCYQSTTVEDIGMSVNKDQKKTIIDHHRTHEHDTGSPEIQVALLTERINQLTEHFKIHTKDAKTNFCFTLVIHSVCIFIYFFYFFFTDQL